MHPYTRLTGSAFERQLNIANERAARASGHPGYPAADRARKSLIKKAESMRPLRRSEFINLYGYQQWRDYTEQYGLPEDHKWADAHKDAQVGPIDRIAKMMD